MFDSLVHWSCKATLSTYKSIKDVWVKKKDLIQQRSKKSSQWQHSSSIRIGLLCSAVVLGLIGCALVYLYRRRSKLKEEKLKHDLHDDKTIDNNNKEQHENDVNTTELRSTSLLNNGRPAVSYNSVEERNIETLNNTKDVPLAEHHELQINMTNDNLNKENNSSYLYNAQDVEKEKSESHQSSYSSSNNNSNNNNCSSTDGTDANKKEAIEEVERLLASPIKGGYNDEYQQRIRTMTRALTMDEANAAPFIGFSLAQYAESQTLVVDGLFKDGPAYQTGIRIGDELLRIADKPVSSIENVREVVAKYCHCGRITDFTLRHPHGEEYTVQLWIMTVEPQFTGQPYFFDVSTHKREESPSRKRYVVGSDELEEIIHVTPQGTPCPTSTSEQRSLSSLTSKNITGHSSNVSRSLINEEDVEQEYGSPNLSQNKV